MDNLLQGSIFVRIICRIFFFLDTLAKGSAIGGYIRRIYLESRLHAFLVKRLSREACGIENAKSTAICTALNKKLCAAKALPVSWEHSLLSRLYRAILSALQKSRLLGWLFADGIGGLVLTAVGGYVLIDWLLRDALAVPVLSSVWDEGLLIFSVFWIVYTRMRSQKPLSVGANVLDLPILLFLAVGLLLMGLVDPYPSIQLTGYRATVQYLLWFFIVTRLVQNDRDFMRVYLTLVGVAAILALHGIYQYIACVPMPSNWVAQAETAVRTRVYSIFGSPNIMGDFMVMFVPMTVALAYHTKNRTAQAFAWLGAMVMCVCCLFTMSRGAWVAMAFTIVLYILLVDRRLFWVMLVCAAALVFVPFVRTRIGFLFTDDFVQANTNGGRAGRWALGLEHLHESNPLLGYGLGMFGGAVAMQNQVIDNIEYFYMDNYYLKILVEMGYFGLITFIVMLIGMISAALRSLFRTAKDFRTAEKPMYPLVAGMFTGLVGVLIHCYFENIFEEPYMMVYFWTIAALIVYAGFLRERKA